MTGIKCSSTKQERQTTEKMSEIELCTMLDNLARTRYGRHSVYQLTSKEKVQIAEELYRTLHLNEVLIRRCLVFPK